MPFVPHLMNVTSLSRHLCYKSYINIIKTAMAGEDVGGEDLNPVYPEYKTRVYMPAV